MSAGASKPSHADSINSRSHADTVIGDRADEKYPPVTFASAAAGALYHAIGAAEGSDALDQLARAIWRGYGEGAINDGDGAFLQSLIDRRRPLAVGRRGVGSRAIGMIASRFTPRRRRTLTDEQKQAARARRRMLGGSAIMPPQLRCLFTEGERAVLAIVAGEIKHSGNCDLAIDAIGALAGVCRTCVQGALHEAKRLGLIKVTERRRPGAKSLTNIIVVVSLEWTAWLRRGPTAHRPGSIGSIKNSAEKNLRGDDVFVSATKSIFKKNNGEKERSRGSGPSQSRWRRRA